MNIAAYVHLRRSLGNATGVGRHINNMVGRLGKVPGVAVTVMAPRQELLSDGSIDPSSMMHGLKTAPLPLSRWATERIWWALHFPKAEYWCPDADWVYAPADAFVPTRRAKFAVTIHDIEAFEDDLPWSKDAGFLRQRRRWRAKLPVIYRHAALVLTVSQFSRRKMIDLLGWDENRIAVVGNGIDERFYEAAQAPIAGPRLIDGPYVVTVGGLTTRKGAPWLLQLAEELRRRGSAIRLAVAGQSDERYSQQAKSLANVVELGYVKDADLPKLLKQSVALTFLSRYEGYGMPAVEAMACGTPAVVSAFASLPEVVGDAGIVVDVADIPAVADLAIQLEKDSALRAAYGVKGLARAAAIRWDACVQRLVSELARRS